MVGTWRCIATVTSMIRPMMHSFIMVFFALIIMLQGRKPSSSSSYFHPCHFHETCLVTKLSNQVPPTKNCWESSNRGGISSLLSWIVASRALSTRMQATTLTHLCCATALLISHLTDTLETCLSKVVASSTMAAPPPSHFAPVSMPRFPPLRWLWSKRRSPWSWLS